MISRKRGFTLIELLVVIAIIAILAAILFPVFARARENARKAACLSNSKQLSLGVHMYMQDYDEKLPYIYIFVTYPGPYQYWFEVAQPYYKNTDILTCPSTNTAKYNATSNRVTDYGRSMHHLPYRNCPFDTLSLATMQRPADVMMFCDSRRTVGGTWNNQMFIYCPICSGANSPNLTNVDVRHMDGVNVGFWDGHAKWMKTETVLYGPNRDVLWFHSNPS